MASDIQKRHEMIKKPDEQTMTERLGQQIADAILSGEFIPGMLLDEQMLAERYDVSRTPVREALRSLSATGLIEKKPRRRAVVTQVNSAQLETLFVAMAELEATCARLASMSMSPVERRRLRSIYEGMARLVADDDRQGFSDANLVFHSAIYAGCHNVILHDMASGLRQRLAPFRHAQFRTLGRLERSHKEHGLVVGAILAGDAAAAHAAMIDHMSLVETAFDALAASAA